jgi:hypothetical protein
MIKIVLTFLALFLMPYITVSAQQLPNIIAKDLNKKPVNWPKDFTAERTILIVAFSRSQQPQIDAWVNALQLKSPGAPPWFETPLIKNPGSFVRSFIDNGMRKGIPGTEARSHVVTIYTDKKAFMAAMNLPDENIHVVVLSRTGKVVGQVVGPHTADKEEIIKAVLKP